MNETLRPIGKGLIGAAGRMPGGPIEEWVRPSPPPEHLYSRVAMSQTCANCRFFGRASGVPVCKRLPPRVVVLNRSHAATRYPEVTIVDWCGEWKPKADDTPEIRYIDK